MKLQVVIEEDETGYYVAEVPALPGCVSQGKTIAEVKANKIRDRYQLKRGQEGMMKKVLAIVVAGMVILGAATQVEAWGKEKAKATSAQGQGATQGSTAAPGQQGSTPASTAASGQQAANEKQLLANNFAMLGNQQARVVVLQQLLNREVADLRSMEAVFCDQYKLDPEKWRKGGYRWDEKSWKFLEQPVQAGK